MRTGLQHLDRVAAAVGLAGVLGDPHPHPLAGQGMPYEHDPAVLVAEASHTVPAVGDRSDVDLDDTA